MPKSTRARAVRVGVAMLLLVGGLTAAVSQSAAAATCTSGVPGDVNGDGYAEVAVGEPRGAARETGAVHVFYGQPSGLVADPRGTALDDQHVTLVSAGGLEPGAPPWEAGNDRFGEAVALGDLNGDGCADLIASAISTTSGGVVMVLPGSPTGLSRSQARRITTQEVFGRVEVSAGLGERLAVGDLDDDGIDDLVFGMPGLYVDDQERAGGIAVLFGDPAGVNRGGTPSVVLTQNSPGMPGISEVYDQFGNALATGDFDGDGQTELAVGVGWEQPRGLVQILDRGSDGYGPQATPISIDSPGVAGEATARDLFGDALAAGDVTGDGWDDLAVGLPHWGCPQCNQGDGRGAVAFLPGSTSGLTGTGSQFWTQSSPGVGGTAGRQDGFGAALAIGALDAGPYADLAIGTRGDAVRSVRAAGSVTILGGSSAGLTTAGRGGERLHQDIPGIAGSVEEGDRFGFSVTASFVQRRDVASLIIGVPSEGVDRLGAAGQFHQLAASTSGPSGTGSRTFNAGSLGVQGRPSRGDALGSALG